MFYHNLLEKQNSCEDLQVFFSIHGELSCGKKSPFEQDETLSRSRLVYIYNVSIKTLTAEQHTS